MHFYIVRHGQSFVNLPGWADESDDWDTSLTELGHRQAEALAEWFPNQLARPDAIYASTMLRARETAQYLADAYAQEITFDDRIREIGNNRLDHSPWPEDEMPTEFSSFWASERPFSNVTPTHELGEAFIHFRARVGSFLEGMARHHVDESIIVVAHGGVVEAAFDHIFNVGLFHRASSWTWNTGITHIEFLDPRVRRERWRLHRHNQTEHLVGLEGD